jgi:hypothetical protein
MMSIKKTVILCFLFLAVFAGCRKNISPSWEVDMNLPLLKSTMTINELIADSLLQTNPDNSLTLVYRNSLYDFSANALIDMPDTISYNYLPSFPGAVIQPGQQIINATEETKFKFNGAEISIIKVRIGKLVVDFTNTLHEAIIVDYTITSATKNGSPLHIIETVPGAVNGNSHVSKEYDISGYSIDMSGQNHISANRITTVTNAMLDPAGSAVTLTAQDQFNFFFRFRDISADYVRGYFGNEQFVFGPESTDFSVFSKFSDGTLGLESVKLKLNVTNGFGMDSRVVFNEIKSVNTRTGNSVSLNDPIIGAPINIVRAAETGDPANPVIPSQYSFNLDNSNITDFIENLPDRIDYKISVDANPLGNVSSGNDFMYYGHYLDAFLDLEIPLSIIANNLTLTDTVAFDLGEESSPQRIKDGVLSLYADNGFPFSADLYLYLLRDDGTTMDSLLFTNHIEAGVLDVNNIVTESTRSVLLIPVSPSKIDELYATHRMLIVARFNTAGAGQYVKIYNNYKLDLKLTGRFTYLVTQ